MIRHGQFRSSLPQPLYYLLWFNVDSSTLPRLRVYTPCGVGAHTHDLLHRTAPPRTCRHRHHWPHAAEGYTAGNTGGAHTRLPAYATHTRACLPPHTCHGRYVERRIVVSVSWTDHNYFVIGVSDHRFLSTGWNVISNAGLTAHFRVSMAATPLARYKSGGAVVTEDAGRRNSCS